MSNQTQNLELFKWDTTNETDKKSKFNIEKSMNENWDKLDANAEDVKDKIESLHSENAELKERLIDAENNQLTGQATGTSIDIYDSADSRVRDVEIGGHSEQDGEPTPENPVEIKSCGDNVNEFDKDNANVLNALLAAGGILVNANLEKTLYIPCQPNTTYTISKTAGARLRVDERNSVPAIGSSNINLKITDTSSSLTYTTSANAKYLLVGYLYTEVDTLTNDEMLASIKIEKGTKATPWSPYGMGYVNEKVQNKNRLPITGTGTYTLNGITFKTNADGSVKISGTATSNVGVALSNDGIFNANVYTDDAKVFKINGNQTYSSGSTSGKIRTIFIENIAPTYEFVASTYNSKTFTYTGEVRLRLSIANGETVDETIYPILEQGSTATPYTPHKEQIYSIPTQQPMRSIGDVRDKFVKVDGTWYERHYIGELILNGSENWGVNYTMGRFQISTTDLGIELKKNVSDSTLTGSLCNYFIEKSTNLIWKKTQGFAIGEADNAIIQVYYEKYSTSNNLSGFKEWLNKNNLIIYAILAKPVDLPCTEEQTTALERARTYKPVTHISSADVVPAYLGITYVRDLETVINNLS